MHICKNRNIVHPMNSHDKESLIVRRAIISPRDQSVAHMHAHMHVRLFLFILKGENWLSKFHVFVHLPLSMKNRHINMQMEKKDKDVQAHASL